MSAPTHRPFPPPPPTAPPAERTSWHLLDIMLRPFPWMIIFGVGLVLTYLVLAVLWDNRVTIAFVLGIFVAICAFLSAIPSLAYRPLFVKGEPTVETPPKMQGDQPAFDGGNSD